MTPATVRTRFAPSPTGRMHLGNVRTALFNFLFARSASGRFVLRSEDTDRERSDPRFLEELIRDLDWLGLHCDEGPETGGQAGPYRQSERSELYSKYLDQLRDQGLAYECWCTPEELAVHRKSSIAAGRPPIYNREWGTFTDKEIKRRANDGQKPAIRFRVPDNRIVSFRDLVRGKQSFKTATIGDFILMRSDGSPSFFYGNALDDALMGITHVFRGEDHLSNTPRQKLLLEALDLSVPDYAHLPLLVDDAGSPLSKRKGAASLGEMRDEGFLPEAVTNYLARLGHVMDSRDLFDLGQLADRFEIGSVGKAPAHFDRDQLEHWQHLAMIGCADDRLVDLAGEAALARVPNDRREEFVRLVHPNLTRPHELGQWSERLFSAASDAEIQGEILRELEAVEPTLFAAIVDALDAGTQDLAGLAAAVTEATGLKGRNVFRPIRLVLTGRSDGPELGPIIKLLPTEILRGRFARWHERLKNRIDQERA